MVQYDLEGVYKPSTFSAAQSMERVHTFVDKRASRAGLVLGLEPPLQEVPHSDSQDDDGGDTTNDATNNCIDGSRICGRNWETRRRYGGRWCTR